MVEEYGSDSGGSVGTNAAVGYMTAWNIPAVGSILDFGCQIRSKFYLKIVVLNRSK